MAWLENYQIEEIHKKFYDGNSHEAEKKQLNSLYKNHKKLEYRKKVQIYELIDEELKNGWVVHSETPGGKANLRKDKLHSTKFEDDVWSMFFNLGFLCLNFDDQFVLPFGKNDNDKKQIDVMAVDHSRKVVFLVECKSAEKKSTKSFRGDIDQLANYKLGFTKSIKQIFGQEYKLKLIFATNNIVIERESADFKRLDELNIFSLNTNTFSYINNIINHYKSSSIYQFYGIVFEGEKISDEKISIPAIEGKMGNQTYFMFAIEPIHLLQIGFVLHRVKANDKSFPTYQRMLVPARLKAIDKFLNDDTRKSSNFFPNSVIINFNKIDRVNVNFEPGHTRRDMDSKSRFGTLHIPQAYAIANIIDGQHRVYGYSLSPLALSETIPVVAFIDMKSEEQLKMFMDVNENQKAVSPSLRGALKANLYWLSPRPDSRMGGLRSSIIAALGENPNFALYGKIKIGEDPAELTLPPFDTALIRNYLIPKATQTKFISNKSNLYDGTVIDIGKEMSKAQRRISTFINRCYIFLSEYYPELFEEKNASSNLIMSVRGTYPFIMTIGYLNHFETMNDNVNYDTKFEDRFQAIQKYLIALCEGLNTLDDATRHEIVSDKGAGHEKFWFFHFQNLIHKKYQNYNPEGLSEWLETKDDETQQKANSLAVKIERYIKKTVVDNLKIIYGEDEWGVECGDIYLDCNKRMNQDMVDRKKKNKPKESYQWTQYFYIIEYKKLIEANWVKEPEEPNEDFETFQKLFSIDSGQGLDSRKKALSWYNNLNFLRADDAHKATKGGLKKAEVDELERIYEALTG